jgi:hypothetical protein
MQAQGPCRQQVEQDHDQCCLGEGNFHPGSHTHLELNMLTQDANHVGTCWRKGKGNYKSIKDN